LTETTETGGWLERLQAAFSFRSRAASRRLLQSFPDPARRFPSAHALLDYCVRVADPRGLFLEFGVGSATSSEVVAAALKLRRPDGRLYGFDSFEGLPERWRLGVPKGAFRRSEPPQVSSSITLIVGRFQETLEPFLRTHPGHVSFVHVDSDLYSSAAYVLRTLAGQGRLVRGTVVDFDEYFAYPGWQRKGEALAFRELCTETGTSFEPIGIVPGGQQYAVTLSPALPGV
jgi:methyltransferase family protein